MQSELGQRLVVIMDYYKLTQNDFGEKFNAHKQEIWNWTRGTKMSIARIGDMLRAYPEINPGWFIIGRGEMLRKQYDQSELDNGLHDCFDDSCTNEKKKLLHELNSVKQENYELMKKMVVLLEKINNTI